MQTVKATIKQLQVLTGEKVNSLYLTIDKEIQAMRLEKGVYNEVAGHEFSINRSLLTAQICELDDEFALYRAMCTEQLNQRQLAVLLIGAEVTINVTKFEVGDEYTDKDGVQKAHDHSGFNYDIVGIKLSQRAYTQIEKACKL